MSVKMPSKTKAALIHHIKLSVASGIEYVEFDQSRQSISKMPSTDLQKLRPGRDP